MQRLLSTFYTRNMSIPVFVPIISKLQVIPSNNISHVDDFLLAITFAPFFGQFSNVNSGSCLHSNTDYP